MKRYKKVAIIILSIVAAFVLTVFVYAQDYYKPLGEAQSLSKVMIKSGKNLEFPGESDIGFIIYPGGKVAEQAYAPLASMLHHTEYHVTILKVPLHLSILDNNAANKVITDNPDIKTWYLIGHSLGGTSASIYAEKHPDQIAGVIFLGSYPYKDLSDKNIACLTITGLHDMVLNKEASASALDYYPPDTKHVTIEGGNHAYFGCYGEQKKDGTATITWQDQHGYTIQAIDEWIGL